MLLPHRFWMGQCSLLNRTINKAEIMLDRFRSTPYSSAPLTTYGEQQNNMVRCPSG